VVNFKLDKKKGDPMRIPSFKKPKLIKKKDPQYLEKAKKEKVSGRVVLEATADKAGNVTDVNVISGHALLAESAVAAVKQWKYEPFIKDGKPEAVRFTVVVNFQLEKKLK
ncbi:MAG: energy transducer TonB, partial [Candidatus Aminicenantes bacterium]|nr:energy transducer TonB [Candidatus Aminicenantes bacterium]